MKSVDKYVYPIVKPHFIRSDRYKVGIEEAEIDGKPVKIYDRERTICDLLLHRNKVDGEVFNVAIQRYVQDPKKVEARLMKYAKLLHVEKKVREVLGVCLMFSLFGCGMQKLDGDGMVYKPAYVSISQDEAKLMMKDDDGHVIVDVRRADEYAQGHIPGAILIPNESITDTPPEELPDKNQIILVYCRTGRRSKEASQKLADMGYVNVYEFGGIEDWTGEIVMEEASDNASGEKAKLSFESFDGGGPDFNVLIADEGIVSYETEVKYHSSDHGEMDGSGFDKIITFTGIKPGETTVVVEERSPIADNLDHKYRVTVDDELNVQIEPLSVKDINEVAGESMILVIDGEEYPVEWEENESVEALKELCPLTVKMSMYGGFEQVGALGESLPRNDEQITTEYGDIVLYSGNQIVVFYGSNTWAYTRLGHIDMTQEELTDLLGNGDVEITLE